MKNWWRTDEELMKNWWRTDKELMKNWWRTDEELMKNWWRTDEKLMKNWWRTDGKLTKNWWRTDEKLMKNWWRADEEVMKNLWRGDEELMKNCWRLPQTTTDYHRLPLTDWFYSIEHSKLSPGMDGCIPDSTNYKSTASGANNLVFVCACSWHCLPALVVEPVGDLDVAFKASPKYGGNFP